MRRSSSSSSRRRAPTSTPPRSRSRSPPPRAARSVLRRPRAGGASACSRSPRVSAATRSPAPRFRLIADDLPGHGRSDWDAGASRGAAQAWRVHETLAPLTQRYTLLGWSLGGQFALDLAAALPAGIERLVLISTTPKFVAEPGWRCGAPPGMLWRLLPQLQSAGQHTLRAFP